MNQPTMKLNTRTKNLINMEFGMLKVVGFSKYRSDRQNKAFWICTCVCGNTVEASANELLKGDLKRCSSCNGKRKKYKYQITEGTKYFSKSHLIIIQKGAISRKLEFSITGDYLDNIFDKQCHKCIFTGLLLTPSVGIAKNDMSKIVTTSLDRIDSNKGYVEGNVQWVHKNINMMKSNMTDVEFINFCKLVASQNP